jgi:hypothetical protein
LAILLGAMSASAAAPTRDELERDLELRATLTSPATLEVGGRVQMKLAVVNRSAAATYSVAKAGDGSEVGWREPHVFFTAERQTEAGEWVEVPKGDYSRCGMFSPGVDAKKLAPGAQLKLEWLPEPSQMLDLNEPGKVRVRAHYAFRTTDKKKSRGVPLPKGLRELPPFELVSAPVELTLVRPLMLSLQLAGSGIMAANAPTELASLFRIELRNGKRGAQKVQGIAPAAGTLSFELQGESAGWMPRVIEPPQNGERTLGPGESVPLLGDAFGAPVGGTWEYPTQEKVKVRAIYLQYDKGEIVRTLRSGWVTVTVK